MNTCDTSRIRPYLAAVALSMGLGLGGCGHQGSTAANTTKAPTSYQGKLDTPPWASSRWHDDRADWQRAITAREQNQSEYARIPN